MPRKKLYRQHHLPYHVFNRVISKDFYPPEKMPLIWKVYCDAARIVSWAFGAQIHALVLMSNHYHLLMSTPEANLDEIMMHFQREVSRHVTRIANEQRYRFQSRYKWELIQNPSHFARTYLYIANNPVEAGLSESCDQYPYSSVSFELGCADDSCPLFVPRDMSELIPQNPIEKWNWLRPPTLSLRESSSSIKKSEFKWGQYKIITPSPPVELF